MYTLIVIAVLLTFLLEPVAASPMMDHAMSASPLDHFYADAEGILNPLCHMCALPFYHCAHRMPQASYMAARALYSEPQPFQPPLLDRHHTDADLGPLLALVTEAVIEAQRQPLINENVRYINANETTVQPDTVQAHIEDTYNPGDRLQDGRPGSRKAASKRQTPRVNGYPCNADGCERTFDRACELHRHQKKHLDRSERPHRCSDCTEAFLYPKDLQRHQRKHIDQPSAQVTFFCHYPGCGNPAGFSRRDNLLRHQRKQHPSMVAVA